jgi:hypothetical protein
MRSSENFMASTGARMRMSSPAVSCSFRYFSTLAMTWASWARLASSQNTAGVLVRRARRTPSLTQSRIAASRSSHMRKMSPVSTGRSSSTLPSSAVTRTVPAVGTSKVLSCEPYSSAFCAINPMFGTVPMVLGSNSPWALQSSMTA